MKCKLLPSSVVTMEYVVDVQGFKISLNEFVYKEVAIVPLEEEALPSVFLFKPPYHWDQLLEKNKSENRWLEQNFHGILWRAGDVPHQEVGNAIRAIVGDSTVYVKGLEKSKWLRRILPDASVQNMEDIGCPSLKKLPADLISCSNHTECIYPVCALRNAMALKKWFLEEQQLKEDSKEDFYSMYN